MSMTGTLSRLPQAATRGFHLGVLKSAATVVAGSFVTSYLSGKAQSLLPILGSNKFAKVATTLLTAGVVGLIGKKVAPGRANELFAGGMVSGVTEGLAEIFPNQVKAIGVAGMGDFANPMNVGNPYAMHGLSDFANPQQFSHPAMSGLNEFVSVPGIAHAAATPNLGGFRDFNDNINQADAEEFLV